LKKEKGDGKPEEGRIKKYFNSKYLPYSLLFPSSVFLF